MEELTKIEDNINKKYFKFDVLENTIIISEIKKKKSLFVRIISNMVMNIYIISLKT